MFPKIDIASEKAIIENWTPEEVADGNREGGGAPSQEIEVFEETKNIGQVGCDVTIALMMSW